MRAMVRARRRVALAGLTLGAAGAYACGDQPGAPTAVRPEDGADYGLVVTSAIASVRDGRETVLGGVRARLTAAGGGAGAGLRVGSLASLAPASPELDAVRRAPAPAPASAADAGRNAGGNAGGGRPQGRLVGGRVRVPNGRTIDLPVTNGKRPQLQVVDDARGGGRPPVAIVTYVDGRPTGVSFFSYVPGPGNGRGPRWRPAATRTTVLDSLGRRTAVITATYDERGRVRTSSLALPDAARALAATALTGLGRLVLPDALHAQTVAPGGATSAETESGSCWVEAANLAVKVLGAAAASAAAAALAASCPETWITCLGLDAALAAVAIAVYEMNVANQELADCRAREGETSGGGGGGGSGGDTGGGSAGGGGGGGGSITCIWYEEVWEDDQGVTHIYAYSECYAS